MQRQRASKRSRKTRIPEEEVMRLEQAGSDDSDAYDHPHPSSPPRGEDGAHSSVGRRRAGGQSSHGASGSGSSSSEGRFSVQGTDLPRLAPSGGEEDAPRPAAAHPAGRPRVAGSFHMIEDAKDLLVVLSGLMEEKAADATAAMQGIVAQSQRSADRLRDQLLEAQRQLDEGQRARDELQRAQSEALRQLEEGQRARDELQRARDELQRAQSEALRQLDEARGQVREEARQKDEARRTAARVQSSLDDAIANLSTSLSSTCCVCDETTDRGADFAWCGLHKAGDATKGQSHAICRECLENGMESFVSDPGMFRPNGGICCLGRRDETACPLSTVPFTPSHFANANVNADLFAVYMRKKGEHEQRMASAPTIPANFDAQLASIETLCTDVVMHRCPNPTCRQPVVLSTGCLLLKCTCGHEVCGWCFEFHAPRPADTRDTTNHDHVAYCKHNQLPPVAGEARMIDGEWRERRSYMNDDPGLYQAHLQSISEEKKRAMMERLGRNVHAVEMRPGR